MSARVAFGYGVLAFAGVGAACYGARVAKERSNSALLGVAAAFVFAAQLVSFPIGVGTSGHLVGSTLATVLLGLPGAIVVMSSVLFVQCFVFADGGVFSLGANVFNMALVGCVVGFCLYRVLCGAAANPTRRVAAAAFAGFCAQLAAAASCAEQLALSDTARLSVLLPAMLAVHALIGVGEAVITAVVVASVLRLRPELLIFPAQIKKSTPFRKSIIGYGLGLALTMAVLFAPIASSSPDGLARVAESLGFQGAERLWLAAPLADYGVPGFLPSTLTTVVAGVLGTLLMYGSCWLLARALVPRQAKAKRAAVAAELSG